MEAWETDAWTTDPLLVGSVQSESGWNRQKQNPPEDAFSVQIIEIEDIFKSNE